MNKIIVAVITLAMAAACSSCAPDSKGGGTGARAGMTVAYVDTDTLLKKWEKYRDMGDQYIKERDELAAKVKAKRREIEAAGSVSEKDRGELIALQNRHSELSSKWNEKMNSIVSEIRSVASEIAADQKIDVVISNSESTPVIEYGGVDITTEILSRLKEKNSGSDKKESDDKK